MDVDVAQAKALLAERFGRTVDAEPAGSGAWSRCFGFEHDGAELVIRFGRHFDDFAKDRFAYGFHTDGLPIPRVRDIGRAYGGFYAISDRAAGTPLEECSAAGWRLLEPSVAEALAAMAELDPPGEGWGVWGRDGDAPSPGWRDELLRAAEDPPGGRTHGWRSALAADPDGETCFQWALGLLDELATDAVPRRVIHGDLINRNVHVIGNTITGIFDWGCSRYGDPLYDRAWFEFWAPWNPLLDVDVLIDGCRAESDRYIACVLHIGVEHLGYNAHLGDLDGVAATGDRVRQLVGKYG